MLPTGYVLQLLGAPATVGILLQAEHVEFGAYSCHTPGSVGCIAYPSSPVQTSSGGSADRRPSVTSLTRQLVA